MSRQDDLEKELSIWQRRLQKRREQKARFGIDTPPTILIEIEDIEATIQKLEKNLAAWNDIDISEMFSQPAATDLVQQNKMSNHPDKPDCSVEVSRHPFSLIIENKEIKGTEEDKKCLKFFGGPGKLIIYAGQVVVLQRHGIITRAVGPGKVRLWKDEKIKAILPLTPQGGVQQIENVMTRDGIPVELMVLHAVRLESASDTKERLQKAVAEAKTKLRSVQSNSPTPEELTKAQKDVRDAEQKLKDLEQDTIIGDDYDQVYESIAKLVGMRAPRDIWGGVQFAIAGNVKDAIMAEYTEDLLSIAEDTNDLESRIYQRKIKEIEDYVKDKSTTSALGKGLKLLTVDIIEIHFPPDLMMAFEEEVKARVEERIAKTLARVEESGAKAKIIQARAKAQARILEGKGEGKAQAALFREILTALRDEAVLKEEEIADALLRLISSTTSVEELESFFEATKNPGSQDEVTP